MNRLFNSAALIQSLLVISKWNYAAKLTQISAEGRNKWSTAALMRSSNPALNECGPANARSLTGTTPCGRHLGTSQWLTWSSTDQVINEGDDGQCDAAQERGQSDANAAHFSRIQLAAKLEDDQRPSGDGHFRDQEQDQSGRFGLCPSRYLNNNVPRPWSSRPSLEFFIFASVQLSQNVDLVQLERNVQTLSQLCSTFYWSARLGAHSTKSKWEHFPSFQVIYQTRVLRWQSMPDDNYFCWMPNLPLQCCNTSLYCGIPIDMSWPSIG